MLYYNIKLLYHTIWFGYCKVIEICNIIQGRIRCEILLTFGRLKAYIDDFRDL